jgi:pilus assembly protein CpaC
MKRVAIRIGTLLLACLAAAAMADEARTASLEIGGHRVFSTTQPLTHIAIADPRVADVQKLSAREVLVSARHLGVTELRLRAADGTLVTWRITVEPPAAVGADSQVQADIRIVEVSRTALMQTGMNFAKNTGDTTINVSAPGSLSGIKSNETGGFTLESNSGFLPIGQAFNLVAGSADQGLLGVMSLLEGNGFAYTLAEPSLTVMNGQTANFMAGGQIPIPISTGLNTISIDYRDYGVRLSLTPTVLDAKRIVLKVAPEVSELDPNSGVQTGGVSVPGLRIRKTETTVQLADGESFVISGLISRSNAAAIDKVPWLGDIPILGAFFKSTRIERNDKELIMIVTPHLVRAIAAGAPTPPLPGAAYGRYRPGFSEVLFLENGRFNKLNTAAKGQE